eukprot:scaffold2261_cov405-Prasinococcus_capsulatus_cf.AAC.35
MANVIHLRSCFMVSAELARCNSGAQDALQLGPSAGRVYSGLAIEGIEGASTMLAWGYVHLHVHALRARPSYEDPGR